MAWSENRAPQNPVWTNQTDLRSKYDGEWWYNQQTSEVNWSPGNGGGYFVRLSSGCTQQNTRVLTLGELIIITIMRAIKNTPIPSHYTSWLIGFPILWGPSLSPVNQAGLNPPKRNQFTRVFLMAHVLRHNALQIHVRPLRVEHVSLARGPRWAVSTSEHPLGTWAHLNEAFHKCGYPKMELFFLMENPMDEFGVLPI